MLTSSVSEEQKVKFAEDPQYYLELRKKLESLINGSFPVMLKDHSMQTLGREVRYMPELLAAILSFLVKCGLH